MLFTCLVRRQGLPLFGLLILVATFAIGCGQTPPDYSAEYQSLVNSCDISDNQRGSFMAPDDSTPIEIVEDSDFTADEQSSIGAAVSEWNRYGNSIGRGNMFTPSTAGVPNDIKTSTTLSCTQTDWGNAGTFYIVKITDATQWTTLGFSSSVPAATLRCYTGGALAQQIIVVRPDLVDPTQITTVVLHELGHSLGLEHSCASSSQSSGSWQACSSLLSTDPYYLAVMYPTIQLANAGSGTPAQTKNTLTQNDEDRANCYYKSK